MTSTGKHPNDRAAYDLAGRLMELFDEQRPKEWRNDLATVAHHFTVNTPNDYDPQKVSDLLRSMDVLREFFSDIEGLLIRHTVEGPGVN